MRILIGDKGNVDFGSPVNMSEQQFGEFKKLLEELFDIVDIEHKEEVRSERLGDKNFQRPWSPEERALLLEIGDNEEVAERLGRTVMSVQIQRGEWVPNFKRWADEKGYNFIQEIRKGNIKKLIEEYVKEKELEKKAKRMERKKEREELENLKEELKRYKSRIKSIELRISCGDKREGDEKRIEEAKQKIKELEVEIKKRGDI